MAQYDDSSNPYRPKPPAKAPVRTAQPQAPAGGAGAGVGAAPGAGAPVAGWQADPVLAQINAFYGPGGPFLAGAQGTYDKGLKELLINEGWSQATDSLFPDANTRAAAKGNPFSILANLAHTHEQNTTNLNEGYNKANLFYSGARVKGLGEEGRSYLGAQAGAASALRSGIGSLSNALTGAQVSAGQNIISGNQTAYGNWLQTQLNNPNTGSGSGTGVAGALRPAVASTRNIQAQRRALLRRNT